MNTEMLQDRNSGLSEGVVADWQPALSQDRSIAGRAVDEDPVLEARRGLERAQQPDGHWVFELEADATIPAEYVLLEHFLGEIDQALEDRIAI
jgi:squalene-hopene/tetraprenyl-beta-curcumene cyclase